MEAAGRVTLSPNEGGRTLARAVEQASTGVHDAIDKVSDAARPVVDRISSSAHQAVNKVASVAGDAAETLGEKGQQLKNSQLRAMEQCRGYVREHPVRSVGIALAAGFLLSRLANWSAR